MRQRRFAIIGMLILLGLCLTLFYSGWAILVGAWKTERYGDADTAGARYVLVRKDQNCVYFDGLGFHKVTHRGDFCERIVPAHRV